ncbi:MAG TPA: DivIVA domain-containing protein [Actinomycetota bacterium]|nr:DivIVA domain-containing protein [Actinomycetota bacterium]
MTAGAPWHERWRPPDSNLSFYGVEFYDYKPEGAARMPSVNMSMAPVTPLDIEKVQFGSTRFRRGYDEDEVDVFLDRLWWTLKNHGLDRTLINGIAERALAVKRPTVADLRTALEAIRQACEIGLDEEGRRPEARAGGKIDWSSVLELPDSETTDDRELEL